MKAIIFEEFGNAKVLKTGEAPKPVIKPDEVLIKISHTSVNPVDWKIREGYLKDLFPHNFPIIPGWDASGTIEAVGDDVKNLSTGDQVYAYARKPEVQEGTYAEYIALKATAVAKSPRGVSAAEAASIPLAGLTAWQSLVDFAEVNENDTVFITGGSGGVGSFAVQFAKARGARVITAASKANHEYLKELGADDIIDYRNDNVSEELEKLAPDGVSVVFDTVGGQSLTATYQNVQNEARIVSIVEAPDVSGHEDKNLKAGFVFVEPSAKQLGEIAETIEKGIVKLPAIRTESIKDAAAQQALNQEGHTRGKVVLAIDF